MAKNLLVMRQTWVRSLGQEDPLEKCQSPVLAAPVFSPGESHGQRAWAATVLVGSHLGGWWEDEDEGLGKGLIVPCRDLDSSLSSVEKSKHNLICVCKHHSGLYLGNELYEHKS